MSEKKKIGNINILDLRKTLPEAVAEIGEIGNVNLVLYTAETAALLSKLSIGNLNSSVEVPSTGKLEMLFNKTTLTHSYFENLVEPVFMFIAGKVIVDTDVTREDIDGKISGLIVAGKVLCPDALTGVFQAKATAMYGKLMAYPTMKQVIQNSLELDENTLRSFENGSELAVMGSLSLPKVLPAALLEQKLKKLFVLDEIFCHEENVDSLKARIADGSGDFKVVPAGFEQVEQSLKIDAILLETLKGKKLYCKEQVIIDADVTAAAFETQIEGIASERLIVVPLAIKSAFVKKCDLLKNQVVFYEGTLFLVEDEQTLRTSYLSAVEGKITLVVTGALTIDPGVDYTVLAERLAKAHNLGAIRCTPDQMGVIQARMGLQKGALEDSTRKEEEPAAETNENYIGNANILVL
jgi:hypothetical protein